MKAILLFIMLLCIISVSCNKTIVIKSQVAPVVTNSLQKYIIKKGNHYADQSVLQVLNSSAIAASVMFDSSAIYTTVNQYNQGDINKLIGFSDCGTEHQQNSARLGWSWNGKNVMIYAYSYVNTERISRPLGPVELNRYFNCSVKANNDYYYFQAGMYTDSIRRHCNAFTGSRYKLFPYFGGDETAPHEISIAIKEID